MKVLVLERRAVENYFPESAIKGEKGSKYEALGPYERLTNAAMPWAKPENWRIARRMKFDDIADTDLGRFLRDL